MPRNNELESLNRIIEEKLKEISKDIVRVKRVSKNSPHGIYVYDGKRSEWVLVCRDGDCFKPFSDGFFIIYFDNTKCPACRRYDEDWFPFVEKEGRNLPDHYFIIVLCDWFAHMCKSSAASKSFEYYDIHASPTTILLYAKNGKVIHSEKYEGYLSRDELREIVGGFRERALRAERGEKVELPRKVLERELLLLLKRLLSTRE